MVRAKKRTDSRKLHMKFLRPLMGPLLLSAGLFYFTFHALSGERGIYALLKEERKLEVMKTELKDLSGQRKDMEHRVRLLSAGSLDLDLLDEQSRSILNEAPENEVMIPLNSQEIPAHLSDN